MILTIEILEPLIKYSFEMLQKGVLVKNCIKHYTNKGLSFDAAKNIVDIAICRYENFTHYKPS
jgi:hypothetical protein